MQARTQDFLTGGGNLIFLRCSKVPGTRGREASETLRLWGYGVTRFSDPQRGPGQSPGNQRILQHLYTKKIKKYIFYAQYSDKLYSKITGKLNILNQLQLATSVTVIFYQLECSGSK